MLTVKIVTTNDETIVEAKQVRKNSFPRATNDQGTGVIGEVRLDTEDGQITYDMRASTPADGSDDQVIYIMNRQGATIATYYI